jgi:hypothetical protein
MYDATGGVLPAERMVVPSADLVGVRPGWIPAVKTLALGVGEIERGELRWYYSEELAGDVQ